MLSIDLNDQTHRHLQFASCLANSRDYEVNPNLIQVLQRSMTDGNLPQRRINHGHVGAAQLGTCDEAGGSPDHNAGHKVWYANEAASERLRDAKRAVAGQLWTIPIFSGFAATIVHAGLGIWMFP